MPLTQEQVNQLAKEAAAQAGGTISYQDALKAAANYGITPEQVNAALSTGVITGAPLSVIRNVSPIEGLNTSPEKLSRPTPSLVEQILASSDPTKWTGEGHGSAQANAEDMAQILSGIGITDLKDFGQITIQVPEYDEFGNIVQTHAQTAFGNKVTGQAVPNTYGERQTGDAFGGTYSGSGNTGYRVQFDAQGNPHFYTSEQSSSSIGELMPLIQIGLLATGAGGLLGGALNQGLGLGLGSAGSAALGGATIGGLTSAATGGNVLQGALLGGAGGYLSGSLGTPATTDASLLAADASQLAAQGLTESQIAQVLGANGYATTGAANLAASMASNGLSIGTMTNQLQNLSTNTGLLQQNISPGSFAAYDTMGLQGAVGNDFAAIEQNLTASGVDPLIAADISQQLAFNPNITHQDLASHLTNTYGNNIYDVNTATTYPTSTLGGSGGVLSDLKGYVPPTTTVNTPTTTTTTPKTDLKTVADIAKVVTTVGGLLGGGALVNNALNGGGGSNVSPTQTVPVGNQDYYNAIQQYYNTYMPTQPRDVATPLQNWYSKKYGA